jgi:hypothetical protein
MAATVRQLLAALVTVTPPMPPKNAPCHSGVVTQDNCAYCRRVASAHQAIAAARQDGW